MKKAIFKKSVIGAILVSILVCASMVRSHCQIPCGIYGDQSRFDMIAENITTIEKSMRQITELSQKDKPNFNQIVRWVQNKENHADELSHVVTYYFMAQRVKPVEKANDKAYEDYVKKLTLLHELLVCSMKAKQTTDLSNVERLRALLAEFRAAYLEEHGHEH